MCHSQRRHRITVSHHRLKQELNDLHKLSREDRSSWIPLAPGYSSRQAAPAGELEIRADRREAGEIGEGQC